MARNVPQTPIQTVNATIKRATDQLREAHKMVSGGSYHGTVSLASIYGYVCEIPDLRSADIGRATVTINAAATLVVRVKRDTYGTVEWRTWDAGTDIFVGSTGLKRINLEADGISIRLDRLLDDTMDAVAGVVEIITERRKQLEEEYQASKLTAETGRTHEAAYMLSQVYPARDPL